MLITPTKIEQRIIQKIRLGRKIVPVDVTMRMMLPSNTKTTPDGKSNTPLTLEKVETARAPSEDPMDPFPAKVVTTFPTNPQNAAPGRTARAQCIVASLAPTVGMKKPDEDKCDQCFKYFFGEHKPGGESKQEVAPDTGEYDPL